MQASYNTPMNDEANQPMKDRILAKIREGQVHMRSKKYRYLRLALTVGVAVLTFIVSALMAAPVC